MTTPSPPEDWESQALFPARLLVGLPLEAQRKFRRAGARLYAVMMEDFEPDSEKRAPTLAEELRSLVEELLILHRTSRAVAGLEAVATALGQILKETVHEISEPNQNGSALSTKDRRPAVSPVRPYLITLSRQLEHREILTDLGDGLATLAREPTLDEWLSALVIDLMWVRTVLEQHIAIRGEISGLGQGDSALCGLAKWLAKRLAHPIALAQAARGAKAALE